MVLREALSSADNPVLKKMILIVPAELLDQSPEQYTPLLFAALRKAIENYVCGFSFSSRIVVARAINDFCDDFFDYAFQKACRLERVFDSTEMDILLLKALQGGSDAERYNQTQAERALQFGMSTNAMQSRICRSTSWRGK